jgi:hypothetical protein
MSRTTARSSAFDLAAAARGLSSARTPSQFTPFIVLSKWESRIVVQAASNVSSPRGTWAETRLEASAAAATAIGQLREAARCRRPFAGFT